MLNDRPSRMIMFCKRKYIKILNISLVIVVQSLPYSIEKDVLTSSIPSHIKGAARIKAAITWNVLVIIVYFFCE